MGASDITCADLAAVPAVGQIKLSWTYATQPQTSGPGAFPYLALDAVEVWAASVNDRSDGSFAKVGEGLTDFIHSGVPEEVTRYYWIRARDASGQYGDWYPSGSTSGVAGKARGMAGLAFGLANGKVVADDHSSDGAVASGALRISVKTSAGNTPSSDDPVFVAVPSMSAGAGGYEIRQIAAALTITIPSGATMGCVADDPFRIRVAILDNSGSCELAVANCERDPTLLLKPVTLDESISTLEVLTMSTGADLANKVYSTSGTDNLPLRTIGSLLWEAGIATPGTWVRPTLIEAFSRGTKKPGDVAQVAMASDASASTVTAVIPYDDTIPADGEGTLVIQGTIGILSTANWLVLELEITLSVDVTDEVIVSILRVGNSSKGNVETRVQYCVAGKLYTIKVRGFVKADNPLYSNPIYDSIFNVYLGVKTSGTTITVNGVSGARKFGGALRTFFTITEIVG